MTTAPRWPYQRDRLVAHTVAADDAVPSFATATLLNDSTFVDHLGHGRALVTYITWAT